MLEPLVLMLALVSGGDLEMQILEPLPEAEEKQAYPVVGEVVRLKILRDGAPAGGAQVVAVYLPESKVEVVEEVGATREDGTIEWTPTSPGLVELTATLNRPGKEGKPEILTDTRTLSIRFDGIPWLGILVMVVAGGFLFGGMILSYRKLVS